MPEQFGIAGIAGVVEGEKTGPQKDRVQVHRAIETLETMVRHDDERGFFVDQRHRFADHLVGLAIDLEQLVVVPPPQHVAFWSTLDM